MAGSRFHRRADGEHRPAQTTTDRRGQSWLCLCLLLVCAAAAIGAVPSATMPPSSYQSGLINRPNPIDQSGNLPITGNVLGGKHFRGPIPYNSTTSFRAPLGSTSLDSFLRYSGVPQTQPGYPQIYSPFHSSTGTVTTTLPGYQGVFAPTSPRIAGGLFPLPTDSSADVTPMAGIPETRISMPEPSDIVDSGIATAPPLRYRSMSENPQGIRDISPDESASRLTGQLPMQPGERLMTPEEVQQRLEQLRRHIDRIQSGTSQLEPNPSVDGTTNPAPPWDQASPPQPEQDSGSLEGLQTLPPTSPRLELYDPSAHQARVLAAPPAQVGHSGIPLPGSIQPDTTEPARLPAWQRIEETSRALDATAKFLGRPDNTPRTGDPARHIPVPDRNDASATAGQPPVAGTARQTYENAGSVTQKQFDHYLMAGERYMQQGQFDRATNSFNLALAYIPHAPQAHLSRSHALLAAGQYAAATAALATAIELDARYVLKQVDLVETLGGPDRFIERITELEKGAESDASPELQLLLAYVYHQMNLPERAGSALESARRTQTTAVAAHLLQVALQAGGPGR